VAVSINISGLDLADNQLLTALESTIKRYKLDAKSFILEITETFFLKLESNLIKRLNQFSDKGFLLAIDDFGTGHSTLASLAALPFDIIKLDRSIIKNIAIDPKHETICKNILKLADELGLKTVAEGVETPEQLVLLSRWHCDYAQGYLIQRPSKLADLVSLGSAGLREKNDGIPL
jgi:EAL domain-containing protein (putative c-di-GMP-specific phosphodiesterase class I)